MVVSRQYLGEPSLNHLQNFNVFNVEKTPDHTTVVEKRSHESLVKYTDDMNVYM